MTERSIEEEIFETIGKVQLRVHKVPAGGCSRAELSVGGAG